MSSPASTTGHPRRACPVTPAAERQCFTLLGRAPECEVIVSPGRHGRTDNGRSDGSDADHKFTGGAGASAIRNSQGPTLAPGVSACTAAAMRAVARRSWKCSRERVTSQPPDSCTREPTRPASVKATNRRVPRRSTANPIRATIAGHSTESSAADRPTSDAAPTSRAAPSLHCGSSISRSTTVSTAVRQRAASRPIVSNSSSIDGRTRRSAGSRSDRTRLRRNRGDAFDGSSTHSRRRAAAYRSSSTRVNASSGRRASPAFRPARPRAPAPRRMRINTVSI